MIDLGDGRHYAIPVLPGRIRHGAEAFDPSTGQPRAALFHGFDLAKVHEIVLPSTTPLVPAKNPDWTAAFYARIEDRAMENALEARAKVAAIIKNVRHYVSVGVIEIVEDSEALLTEELTLTAAEASLIGATETPEPRAPKPSEIARAAGMK